VSGAKSWPPIGSGSTVIQYETETGGRDAQRTDEYIVFVEVKTRSADYQVSPTDAVNVPKQRTIIFAASNYINQYNLNKEARFDIITIIINGRDREIDHIENAFYPTM
jgi:putative endonuclease